MQKLIKFIHACLVIGGVILGLSVALSFADAHAVDLSNVHVKAEKAPQTYEICDNAGKNCKEGNSGEATLALLNKSGRVFIVTRKEQQLEAGKKGINLATKK